MQCSEAQEVLSAYFDGELPSEMRAAVDRHVTGCARCQEELASFRRLSELATSQLRVESPDVWSGVQQALERGPTTSVRGLPNERARRRIPTWILVAAASLLVGVVIGRQVGRMNGPSTPEPLAARLEPFFAEFARNPLEAEKTLLATYSGKAITVDEAIQTLKYEPVANRGLPDGYRVKGLCLLDMPCCPCLLTVIEAKDGRRLCLFEHDAAHAAVSTTQPSITAECHGRATKIVQLDGQLAAIWPCGQRCVTLVGPDKIDEIVALVERLNSNSDRS